MPENLSDTPRPEIPKRRPRVLRTLGEMAGFAATAATALVFTGPVQIALGARNLYHKYSTKHGARKSNPDTDTQ